WLKDPKSIDPNATMPNFHLTDQAIDELSHFLFAAQVPKELAGRIEAAAAEPVGSSANGKKLVSESRCITCSTVEGKGKGTAPELSKIASTASRGWLLAFLREPQAFNPRTPMPRYHFSEAESRDIVAFLEDEFPDFARTLPAWLAAKLESPRSFADGLKMPSYGFNADDSRAVTTALLALGAQPVPDRYRYAPPQKPALLPGGPVGGLIQSYRCLSCHQIGDRGADVSTAPLTFEGSKVKRDWLVDYLMLSYTLRPILEERMPVLRMPREDATQLAHALQNFYVDPSIHEDPFAGRPASDADPAEGQRLYVGLGCRGCHILGSSGGYYGPPLTEAGH